MLFWPGHGLIEVAHLMKRFGDRDVIRDVSFTIRPGEATGYLGPNGAGKSTTLKILSGLLRPDGGTVRVCGHDLATDPVGAKRCLGYVPDEDALFDTLTPNEYLSLIAELHHLDRPAAADTIRALFAELGLGEAADRPIESLSRGQRQKVLIAAALVHDPEVLLLDEPLNGLDVNTALAFRGMIEALVGRGKTVLFTSHILEVIERVCRRTILIDGGRVVADAPTAELVGHAGSLEAVFRRLTGPAAGEAPVRLRAT